MLNKIMTLLLQGSEPVTHAAERPSSKSKVWFDDEAVYIRYPSQPAQSISWSSLSGVSAETTDAGPHADDLYWHLSDRDKTLVVPSLAKGADQLALRLQDIPSFDKTHYVRAMGCSDNELFSLLEGDKHSK